MALSYVHVQGRHTKTGQLAAIKVMNVTEVSCLLKGVCEHLLKKT